MRLAHIPAAMRAEIRPAEFVHAPWQWGQVSAAHSSAQNTTLYAAVSAGATSIETNASVGEGAYILIGTLTLAIRVTSVSGSAAPYTLELAQDVGISQASGATVSVLNTLDLYLDGATALTYGVRYLKSYTPTVNDVVVVGRYGSDRFVLDTLA